MAPQLSVARDSTDGDTSVTQNQECLHHRTESQSRRRSARHYRPPQRYYSHHTFQTPTRHYELRSKCRISARQPLSRDQISKRPELRHSNNSASSGDQNATCLSSKPCTSEGRLLEHPIDIPQMVTPSARENTFTEAMNGAFNLTKSPLWLGRKLAAATLPEKESWLLQNPCNPFGSDTNSHTGSTSSMTDQSQKEAHNLSRLVNSQNQPDRMTVGFGLAQSPTTVETDEFSRLLQSIELHSRQSKGLADMVSSYLEGDGSHSDINSAVGDVNKFYTKPPRRPNQSSECNLQVASLPGGGDSPDPPRDHSTPFRGHMIDRIDSGGPVVDVEDNNCGPATTTVAPENISQDEGPRIASDRQGLARNHTTAENNHTPASCNGTCTYFAMPLYGLPQERFLSTSDFGGFYDTFLPSEKTSDVSSKKRPGQNIEDACQCKLESSFGCCSQKAKAYVDKPYSSEELQVYSHCRECHPKRVKVDHLAAQSDSVYHICVAHQPFKAPLLSPGGGGSHPTEATPGYQQSYECGQKSAVVPATASPQSCACPSPCSCPQPCACEYVADGKMTLRNAASSAQPPLGISIKSLLSNPQNCACRPHCSCPSPCQCGQDTYAKVGMRDTHPSVQLPLRTSICAFPLFQVQPRNPDFPTGEVISSEIHQCGGCEMQAQD
ncbi:hypothetical protein BDDG_05557 [Blastomyces dermatitidis ATCC 18188]|uniref:Uncharacterized protein n=1 Tax=Ajellomyces dermatitidis (strain ATCC 18188 / CBS 674.68) TaxID=653446 RepID=F2THA0_AJEDA|nr:hypothetical protein BDDG_05557 [Blastomyces dermatitidis ATCC 18188]